MKKVAVAVVIIIAVILMLRAKMAERDSNEQIAEDYFIEVCGIDQGCADRLVRFRPCFSGAYRLSLIPGKDRVDVDHLVQCLNGKYPVPKFDAVRNAEVPFPTAH